MVKTQCGKGKKMKDDYIIYLESKISELDYRIKELESTMMLVAFSEANQVNRDMIYLMISKQVWKSMPFSHETIAKYKELLHDLKGQI